MCENFLSKSKFCTLQPGVRPISWVELYTLYRCKGYPKPLDDPESPGLKRATLTKQLQEFKRLVRATTSKTLAEQGARDLFKPTREIPDALVGVGIAGKLNAISCNIFVNDCTAAGIAKHLIWVNRKITGKQVDQFLNKT